MIHYHGTPITPRADLYAMSGRHFCISFARPDDLRPCLQIAQSLMFDNGAFSTFTRGETFSESAYYEWLDPILSPPHWGIVPDVIGGNVEAQRERSRRWPFPRQLGAPVWHLGLPFDYLFELVDEWPRVCLGSSAEFWNVGAPEWCQRMDEIFNALARRDARMPWLHGLRMLGQAGERWPLASADSTNVAQNYKARSCCAERMASLLDSQQCPTHWNLIATQQRMDFV